MSRKQPPTQPGSSKVSRASQHDWLAPVSEATPCGPDLEYDHDFVVLFASAAPKQDVQYGTFVGSPDPLNWSELERDCRRLMLRTKDIRVAILYTRCRTRLAGAIGLAEGMRLLAAWLDAFPEHVHPQPAVDSDRDAALEMRINALQALADPEGLLADVREIVLTKSTLARLQVRDVERAFAHPRAADALAPESVGQQLRDLRSQQLPMMTAFDEAVADLSAIAGWSAAHLGPQQPDLSPLTVLLQRLVEPAPFAASAQEMHSQPERTIDEARQVDPTAPGPTVQVDMPHRTPVNGNSAPADREAALALIRMARNWFEVHEPSSPIPVLLRRAEQFVGKRYAETVKAIPGELLALWEEADRAQ